MPQLNIQMTPEFAEALERFMRMRALKTKSEAVRVAVQEGLERARAEGQDRDYTSWLGLGLLAPQNQKPRFVSDDDLWS